MILHSNDYLKILPAVRKTTRFQNLGLAVLREINERHTKYGILSRHQKALFLCQAMHESKYLTDLEEDLGYSANGLIKTFRAYRDEAKEAARKGRPSLALQHQYKPELIANTAYANRNGNGDTESGDGWRFRGMGIFQTTGRANYEIASERMFGNNTLLQNPELLLQPEYAVESALVYWDTHRMNQCKTVKQATSVINPALFGLKDRLALYNLLLRYVTAAA